MAVSYDSEKLEASQPFLNNLNHDFPNEDLGQPSTTMQTKQSHRLWNRYSITCHLLILVAYSFAFFFAGGFKSGRPSCTSEILPLPAREAVKWELRPFTTSLVDNPFTGTPRPALDQAWHNLLKNDHIKVPHQTLKALNLSSVELKDQSGDVASLGTFHALHCLKKIRQMSYKEHYHHGKNTAQMLREQAHSDHCIEYIREYLMCKPDLSLVTFHWINNTAQHADNPSLRLPTSWDHSQHECANWETLNAWAGERVVDLYRYELLRQPEHGLSYDKDN